MLIDFESIPETVIPNMLGGKGALAAHMHVDALGKIILGCLPSGGSVGLHTHSTSSEIIYILSGTGKVLCDGEYEPLAAGSCHYCPKDHEHSLINDSDGELQFFAVVPEQ